MTVFNIKPKAFYDRMQDAVPSQPYSYDYGDRPTFTFNFLPDTIAEGDLLVFAVDNDMLFYDSTPENILHSATCMVVVKHEVTVEEAIACSVDMRIETRTVKFRDTINGKVRPLDVVSGLYLKHGSGQDTNYVLLAKARAFANGIIADYDSLPEPITIDNYYTKDEIDAKFDEKADEDDFTAHTSDTDIHVTVADKSTWDSKADITDIPTEVSQLNNDSDYQNAQQVSASISTAIADKADRSEIPTVVSQLTNDAAYQTEAQVSATVSAAVAPKADSSSIYTKTETDTLLGSKADVATTLSGYGITDAYTKSEVDNKIASVYRYCGTVSTYADLPASGQEIGDVYNVETADAQHGIKDGDNVAWNGTTWDVLAGTVDLSGYLEKPATAGTTGQVLTVTADGSAWQDVPTEIPAGGSVGQVLTMTSSGLDWNDVPDELPASTTQDDGKVLTVNASGEPEWKEPAEAELPYLCFTADNGNSTVLLKKGNSLSEPNLEYSTDGKTWTGYSWVDNTNGETIALANPHDRVWFKGNNSTFSTQLAFYTFAGSGRLTVSGNIMSLLDETCQSLTIPTDHCFAWLFYGFTAITDVENLLLPALTLKNFCYTYMFYNCRFSVAPKLPATALALGCYRYMFSNCTSLVKPPVLPATSFPSNGSQDGHGVYHGMFLNCTALTETPALPATTMRYQCYKEMFKGCSSLTTAPLLKSTTLAYGCYWDMFSGCSNLTKASKLPATTLEGGCYYSMFEGCTSLTETPNLSAYNATSNCYRAMFKNCTNLEKVNTFSTTNINRYSNYCFYEMFSGCTKLRIGPKLSLSAPSHTTCLQYMFAGCNALEYLYSSQVQDTMLPNSYKLYFDCPSSLDTSVVPSNVKIIHGANKPDFAKIDTWSYNGYSTFTVFPSFGEIPRISVTTSLVLDAYVASTSIVCYAEVILDVSENATVTAGENLSFYETPIAGKRNICEIRWASGVATLRIKYAEDLA